MAGVSMHKITKAEVVPDKGAWGVRFEFDDGIEDYHLSGSKELAEWDALDRVGEELPVGSNSQLRSVAKILARNNKAVPPRGPCSPQTRLISLRAR
jgi:hypothetical protein